MPMAGREFNLSKSQKFSQWYNDIIYAADLVDIRYNVQGFVVHRPWGMQTIKKLYSLFEAELEADSHLPVLFPTLIPEENLQKEKEHFAGFVPNVFIVTQAGNEALKRRLVLRPTSETAFYQLYNLWVQSPSDLPLKLYQSCSVFRFEHETLPFMRGREFLWIETHDAFATRAEAEAQVQKDIQISLKVMLSQLGVPLTVFQRPEWDKFPGADHTYAYDVLMPDGKVLQAGATHLLGQHFTKAFDVKYKDESGNEVFPQTTCFGPGIWRMIAAIISVHGDDKGLILPPAVAPIQVVVVPIAREGDDNTLVMQYCRSVVWELTSQGIRSVMDDSKKTPGFKFNYWEMKGVPLRVEVGLREVEADKLTVVRRTNRQKTVITSPELVQFVKGEFAAILESMTDKSTAELATRTYSAGTREELKEILDKTGGLVKIPFCSIEKEGTECGAEVQSLTAGGKVRGINMNSFEAPKTGSNCIVCGKPAKLVAYVARQY